MARGEAAQRAVSAGWGEAALSVGAHAVAVVAIAYVSAVAIAGSGAVADFVLADGGAIARRNTWSIAGHLLASAIVWGALLGALRAAPLISARAIARRGQVAVETLIVIMPMLLLFLGMVQLALNNIAAMLTDLAAYQAGRAAWIWQYEGQRHDGSEMSGDDGAVLRRKARLAAASALAPVAPASYRMTGISNDPELHAMRAAAYAYFDAAGSSGSRSSDAAAGVVGSEGMDVGNGKSGLRLDAAFDHSGMPQRAARKLSFAYEATSVQIDASAAQISTTVTYRHYLSVPVFGSIFSTSNQPVAGLAGSYTSYTRTYTLAPQIGVSEAPWTM